MGAETSTPEERLAELGLSVPEVAKPVAAYIPAVRSGNLVFTSGQLPMREGQLMATGKVGGEVSSEEAVACAQQCALNALAAVRAELEALKSIKATLTSIAKGAIAVQASLDAIRDAIVARVADAEAEIRRPAAS